jgi:Putative prokaryotic signal transducing protein
MWWDEELGVDVKRCTRGFRGTITSTPLTALMKRLLQAPNLALATLWADQLVSAGIDANVQRAYASGIAGEIPPDQALPEVWVLDGADHARATTLLHELQNRPHRHWLCQACGESVDGPFDQCWNCGRMQVA